MQVGNLKVIGGERRGFPLLSSPAKGLRPTSNRVRKALFDILGERIRGCRILDLFAGTGAVGIEALSRGARSCHFVEEDAKTAALVGANLRACRLQTRGEVFIGRLPQALRRIRGEPAFDFVFVDPPYEGRAGLEVLEELGSGTLLSRAGWVVLEHRKATPMPSRCGRLAHFRTARYGDSELSFFALADAESAAGK